MQGLRLADRYELLRPLGEGGMASVWLARDGKLDREVAIKRLHPALARALDRARFRREALLLARLAHPHLLAVYDCSEEGEPEPWIAAEYVQGEALSAFAARERPPPVACALLGLAIAEALGALHREGILHRDVKPANVLLGDDGRIKLADLGIARAQEDAKLTASGEVTGSIAYLPPERIDGLPEEAAGDVFSTGVLLYELIAGRLPFQGPTTAATIAAIAAGRCAKLSEGNEACAPDLEALVHRCLSVTASERPADGGALAAELSTCVEAAGFGAPEALLGAWRRDRTALLARLRREGAEREAVQAKEALARGDAQAAARALRRAKALQPGASVATGPARLEAADAPHASPVDPPNAAAKNDAPRPRDRSLPYALLFLAALLALGWWTRPSRPAPGSAAGAGAAAAAPVAGAAPDAVADAAAVADSAPVAGAAPDAVAVADADAAPIAAAAPAPAAAAAPIARAAAAPAASSSPAPARPARPVPAAGEPFPGGPISWTGISPPPPPLPTSPGLPSRLELSTRPWAHVTLDGAPLGTTPRLREASVPSGRRRLRFENPACEPEEREVDLPPGGTLAVQVELRLRPGHLIVHAPTGAQLFDGERSLGVAPLPPLLDLPAGTHELIARHEGREARATVVLRAGERRVVELRP